MNGPKGELTVVTPAMAETWLKTNTDNRKINRADVTRYANDMTAGAWKITHQGIGFDVDGRLIDGQHRLHAVIEAAIPVTLMVTWGLPTDAQEAIDAVRPRTVADQLYLIDHVTDSVRVAAICRGLATLDDGKFRKKMSLHETRTIRDRFGNRIARVLKFHYGQTRLTVAPYLAPLVYALAADETKVMDFATKVRDGENIRKGDPAYALREYLLAGTSRAGGDTERETTTAVTLRAIYAALHGQSITILRTNVLSARDSEIMTKIMEFFRLANNTNM